MQSRTTLFALTLCALGINAHADTSFSSLDECMSYKDFVGLGLDKLTPEQRHGLDAWVRAHGATCAVAAAPASAPTAAANSFAKPEAKRIESRIAGEFDGWRHGTVLVLENGQRWEVRDEEPVSARLHSPKVIIEPGLLNGWTLSVEGVGELAHVLPAERH
ncbi:MAG: hypothetical protein DYH18_11390 [Xanthomonadales bacterium PRO7]|jgi:hypothetical protein|nr:hypothetical protein [Xanthomonadales bacterium PRO7]HMM57862.1 hypothetical protein [Rudaea sp.]